MMERNDVAEASSVYANRRKYKSAVWIDFERITKDDGSVSAKCKHCKKLMQGHSKNGTSHLRKHLGRCVPCKRAKRGHLDVRELLLKFADAEKDKTNSIQPHEFDQDLSRHELARMIILHEYPFSIAEDVGFRSFVRSLQPLFPFISCDTIRSDCMKIFESERQKLYDLLNKLLCRISLSADLWSSSENLGHIRLTTQYIDEDWNLQKKILNFCPLEIPHTGEVVAKCIMEKLLDWNIDMKLSSIVLENCFTNNVMVRELVSVLQGKLLLCGDVFYVCCWTSTLNLIVQDGLGAIQEVIDKIRESINYIKSSQLVQQKFNEVTKKLQAPQKSIVLDDPSRWDSTYLMLAAALEFKDVLSSLTEHDSNYKHALTLKEWENTNIVCNCLEIFYEITQVFASMKYPPSNVFFVEICSIHLLLKEWCKSSCLFLVSMASNMMDKLEKYWSDNGMILAVAAILDPRLKMKSVEYYFPLIYGSEAWMRISDVRNCLKNLYKEYMARTTPNLFNNEYVGNAGSCSSSTSDDCEAIGAANITSRNIMFERRRGFEKFLKEISLTQQIKSDLEMYLDEAVHPMKTGLDENFDILAWWKFSAPKYPIVAQMARDILGIPVSSTTSEAVFDIGGRVLDKYRSSMPLSTLQSLICAQDWLKNELQGDLIFKNLIC